MIPNTVDPLINVMFLLGMTERIKRLYQKVSIIRTFRCADFFIISRKKILDARILANGT